MSINADLKFGKQRERELPVREHVPYLRHIDENIIVTKSGFLVGVIKLSGLPFQTMDQSEINNRLLNRNLVFRNLGSSRFAVYSTVIRRRVTPEIDGDFDNAFTAELNERYLHQLKEKHLFVNETYLSIIRRPMRGKVGMVESVLNMFKLGDAGEEAREEIHAELKDLLGRVVKDFKSYGARILGIAERDGNVFSEPGEFFAKILAGGQAVSIPMPRMHLADACATRQIFIGKSSIEFKGPTGSKLGAVLGIKEYPPYTVPGSVDGLLRLPYEFILTQSFAIEDRHAVHGRIQLTKSQLRGSDDAGTSIDVALDEAANKLAGGDVLFGQHHLSVLALGSTPNELKNAVSEISAEINRASIVPVLETLNMEPAFWAQLPGNFSYIARRSLITSSNFAGLFSGHNFPSGQTDRLHWGLPISLLETTSQTAYYFNFHVDDVGHFTVFGPTGSGKTVAMSFLLAQAMRVQPRPRCIYFDYMRGAEIFVRAMGGRYEVMEPMQPTGFAPFQMEGTPENKNFLENLLQYILAPEDGELEVSELRVINQAIDKIYRLPVAERTFDILPQVLRGSSRPGMNDLAARIEPWIDQKSKGWLFNNKIDEVDFEKGIVGFDMTKILNDKKLRSAALLYIFHRIEQTIDGDPIMLFLDEGWKLLDDEVFSEFIKDSLKTIRRRNGVVGFGTQTAEDVVSSSISSSLIEQTKTNIFFPNAKADEVSHRQRFRLSEKEFNFVRNASKESRTFLIKHDSDSVIAKLDLSGMPDLIKVLSSNDLNVKECERLRNKFGEDPASWLPYFCGWEREDHEAA